MRRVDYYGDKWLVKEVLKDIKWLESRKILIIALLIFGASIHAQAAERGQGILEIRVKDHRDAIGDFAELIVTIEKISVSPKPGLKFWQTGWKDLAVTSEPIDLTKYVGKKTAQVFRAPIDAGAFDAFHLKIKSIAAILKKAQRKAPVKNTIGPVQTKLRHPA